VHGSYSLSLVITGHGPPLIFPWDDAGPTNVPSNAPFAMIVYVTPHCRPLIVTVANPLILGAAPEKCSYVCTYVHILSHTSLCKLNHNSHGSA